jgi:hypothetical protein
MTIDVMRLKLSGAIPLKNVSLRSQNHMLTKIPNGFCCLRIIMFFCYFRDCAKVLISLHVAIPGGKINNAACKLKFKDYKQAEKLCTKVASIRWIAPSFAPRLEDYKQDEQCCLQTEDWGLQAN